LASGNNSCKLLILSADPFWNSLFSFSTILTWIYSVVVDGLPCSAFFLSHCARLWCRQWFW
jgi:hypothetical protein